MPRVIADSTVEPVVRVLLGVIDVDGGATDEQLAVLRALVSGYWGRTDLDVGSLAPLDPASAAAAIIDPAHRRRVRELMVTLELCRHPLSEAQVARVEEYAAALEEHGPGLELARTLVTGGAQVAAADYTRFLGDRKADYEEPSLRGRPDWDDAADEELATRLRALHDLPAGTLGYEYSEVHWLGFLGNLSVHEAGFLAVGGLVPKVATLTRPGATELVAGVFSRGSACTDDFTTADHLALVNLALAEVRERFGVPPLDD